MSKKNRISADRAISSSSQPPSNPPHRPRCSFSDFIRVANIILAVFVIIFIVKDFLITINRYKLAYGYGYSAGIVYEQMEKDLKVYMYRDRDAGAYFQSPGKLTGIYGKEAYFFKNIKESRFGTTESDPLQAQAFFIPISWNKMRSQGTAYENMTTIVPSLILAADHFFETCHDIGVDITEGVPLLEKKSIRHVCPASYDIFLPQVNQSFYRPAAANATVNRTEGGLWAGISYSEIKATLKRLLENHMIPIVICYLLLVAARL